MINPQERSYRDKKQIQDINLRKKAFLEKYLGANKWLISFLNERGINFGGKILELGAGVGWCSAELSKIPAVETIYALDFSKGILEKLAPKMLKYLKANVSKINFIVGDMHHLDFPKETFDFVIFSASLHHAMEPSKVLQESYRILKNDGKLLALNEPIAPSLVLYKGGKLIFRQNKIKKAMWNEPEDWGGPRHIYTMKEWQKIFLSSGFNPSFIPYFLGITPTGKIVKYSPIRFLNGLMFFSLFQMVAEKFKVEQ